MSYSVRRSGFQPRQCPDRIDRAFAAGCRSYGSFEFSHKLDPLQTFATTLMNITESDIGTALRSLIEDSDDGFGCFETIEPYMNANRISELDDATVLNAFGEMRAIGSISVYHYVPDEDRYEMANAAAVNQSAWYRATEFGIKQYDQKYQSVADR